MINCSYHFQKSNLIEFNQLDYQLKITLKTLVKLIANINSFSADRRFIHAVLNANQHYVFDQNI